jgi:chemotaxis protein MotA
MLAIVGIVLVIGMVFGGYLLAGGHFGIILHALPFELMMIGGAAAGTFLIANKGDVVKGALMDLRRVVAGPHWGKSGNWSRGVTRSATRHGAAVRE